MGQALDLGVITANIFYESHAVCHIDLKSREFHTLFSLKIFSCLEIRIRNLQRSTGAGQSNIRSIDLY